MMMNDKPFKRPNELKDELLSNPKSHFEKSISSERYDELVYAEKKYHEQDSEKRRIKAAEITKELVNQLHKLRQEYYYLNNKITSYTTASLFVGILIGIILSLIFVKLMG